MSARFPFWTGIAGTLLLAGLGGRAHAQFGGQPGGMGPGMGPAPMGEEPKEEGPAEAAPDEDNEHPADMQPLGGYAAQARKRTQIIELDGYFRVRTDWLHNLNLGQGYTMDGDVLRSPPFPLPLECGGSDVQTGCSSKNLADGNLRLRLEPIINVTDQVRVMSQIDVLDNIVLGSSADSLVLARAPTMSGDLQRAVSNQSPLGALYRTQDPPEIGKNGWESSLRARRAWGEVDTEFGSLRFGRMPWHFGRGIAWNSGNCMDCEGGTTVDRLMATTQIYGHTIAAALDWGASGYHVGMVDFGRRDFDQPPLDLSQRDDVFQAMAALTLLDDERRFRDKVDGGDIAINYGVQLVYRGQGAEVQQVPGTAATAAQNTNMPVMTTAQPSSPSDTLTRDQLAAGLKSVSARVFLPGLWFKLGYKILTVEAEGQAVLGHIDNAGILTTNNGPLTLQQVGWVLATDLRLYRNAFFLGFETGGATGDQAENTQSYLNYRWKFVQQPTGDSKLTDFKFNPDYQVDQILFRRILGTVTNAVYFKPTLTYWLDLVETRQIGATASLIYSLAPVRVSTPGNSLSYGVELDLGLNYRNPSDGFYAGAVYGVLWPMGALDRGIVNGATTFSRIDNASSAQVFRTYLGIKF